jgi:hypothetical protein
MSYDAAEIKAAVAVSLSLAQSTRLLRTYLARPATCPIRCWAIFNSQLCLAAAVTSILNVTILLATCKDLLECRRTSDAASKSPESLETHSIRNYDDIFKIRIPLSHSWPRRFEGIALFTKELLGSRISAILERDALDGTVDSARRHFPTSIVPRWQTSWKALAFWTNCS